MHTYVKLMKKTLLDLYLFLLIVRQFCHFGYIIMADLRGGG